MAASTRAAVSRFWRSHRGCSQPGCLFLSRRLMLDAHNLRCVFPHRFYQFHLLLDQFAVGDQLLHLPFFRYKLFPARILQLLFGPSLLLVDLISLRWIRRVARVLLGPTRIPCRPCRPNEENQDRRWSWATIPDPRSGRSLRKAGFPRADPRRSLLAWDRVPRFHVPLGGTGLAGPE